MIHKINEKNLLFIQVAYPIFSGFTVFGARLRKMVPDSENGARLRIINGARLRNPVLPLDQGVLP